MGKLQELIEKYCPDGVEYKALAEVASFGGGHTPSKAVSDNYEDNGIWWVTSKDVKSRELSVTSITLSEIGAANLMMYPAGTLVMVTRSGILKRMLPVSMLTCPMTVNQDIKAIMVDESLVMPKYLLYVFESEDDIIRRRYGKAGGTVDSLNFNLVKKHRIPVPPIEVQREIVRLLDAYTAAHDELVVKLNEEMSYRKQLQCRLGKELYVSMFGHGRQNEMGWPQKELGSIARVGSSKRVFKKEFVESGVPFFRGTEIGQLAEGRELQPSLYIRESHYDDLCDATGKPSTGDMLLPSICPDARVWLVDKDEDFYFKDGRVLWIQSSQCDVNSIYLHNAVKERLLDDYLTVASGSTFAEVKIFSLARAKISIPPEELQEEFAWKIDLLNNVAFSECIEAIEAEVSLREAQLTEFRNQLLSFPEKVA